MSCSQLLKELRATAARILRPSAASRRELVHIYVARKASLVGKRVIDEATSDWHFSDIEASRFNVRCAALPPQQNAAYEPRSYDPRQNSERKPGAWYPLAASEAEAPNSSGSDGGALVEWAKVVLTAKMHDQASVSSPTVRFYSPGTDLQVFRREGGWLQVSDPVTQEHGWVLAKYPSTIDGPTSTQAALESTTEAVPANSASPKSKKWSKSSKRSKPAARISKSRSAKPAFRGSNYVARWDPRSVRWARHADRRREFAPLMFGPFAR
jgi:hypothetical protein